jgi:hypothetical protein
VKSRLSTSTSERSSARVRNDMRTVRKKRFCGAPHKRFYAEVAIMRSKSLTAGGSPTALDTIVVPTDSA